jgi:hypothetical protein
MECAMGQSSPSFSASVDYIPRVSERIGILVNIFGPNTQLKP